MAEYPNNHDDVLMKLLIENKTLVGFLFSVFGFLSRKTDFYMIRNESEPDSAGFPSGVAEELVVRVIRKCAELNKENTQFCVPENCHDLVDDNECIPPPVGEEVEIEATEYLEESQEIENVSENSSNEPGTELKTSDPSEINLESLKITDNILKPPETNSDDLSELCELSNATHNTTKSEEMLSSNVIKSQLHFETYNGAKRDKYSWCQTIQELDVTVHLPLEVKSSKQLKISITCDYISVKYLSGLTEWNTLMDDNLSKRVKQAESIWTMSEGKIRIHLEKQTEMWWNSLLLNEEKIDTSKIDCSRPLDELPEEHIAKVRELQWNQMQKLAGKPTSDELKKEEILKKAWNMPGSPFANTPFDPNVLH